MGKRVYDSHKTSFLRVEKRGIRMKTLFGNRFIGGRLDSSERSFGRTFVSNALLAPVIYKHIREPDAATSESGCGRCFAYLCGCYTTVLMISSHPVSVPFLLSRFAVIDNAYLMSSMCLSSLLSNKRRS